MCNTDGGLEMNLLLNSDQLENKYAMEIVYQIAMWDTNLILDRWLYLSRVPMLNEVEISLTQKYKIASTHTLFFHRKDTARVRVQEDIRAKIKQKCNFSGKAKKLKLSLFLTQIVPN